LLLCYVAVCTTEALNLTQLLGYAAVCTTEALNLTQLICYAAVYTTEAPILASVFTFLAISAAFMLCSSSFWGSCQVSVALSAMDLIPSVVRT
jgi:hypothetical protein